MRDGVERGIPAVPSLREVLKEIERIPKCPRSGEVNILHLCMERKRLHKLKYWLK